MKCDVPENDPELAQLVLKVQRHKRSATCRRNGKCRFHYPWPPSPKTLIAREDCEDACKDAQRVLAGTY